MPITLVFLPAKDIATFVGEGKVKLGITGEDMVAEVRTYCVFCGGGVYIWGLNWCQHVFMTVHCEIINSQDNITHPGGENTHTQGVK